MTTAHIINTFCFILPCFVLLLLTFRNRLRTPVFLHVAAAILLYLAITFYGSGTYIRYNSFPLKYLMIGLSTIILGAVIFDAVTGYRFGHGIFIVAVAKCYSEHVSLLSAYIFFLLEGRLPSCSAFDSFAIRIAMTAITFPFIYYFFRRFLRPALDYTASFSIWNQVWIIPSCNNLLHNLLFSQTISSPASAPEQLFYFIPPLWTVLTFATYILIMRMVVVVIENANLSERLHISETVLASQHKQAESLQRQIEQTSRQRHDMRHHLLVIHNYIKAENIQGLSDYIKEYSASLTPGSVYCDNFALNSLLGYYKELSENSGAAFDTAVSLPEELPISDMDLCAIVSNLLENAVEACARMSSEERFIHVKISATTSFLLAVIVENSYEGEILRSGEVFLSSKKKGRKGIGISSVLHIIEQYHGISKFEYQDQIFKVSILLNAK